MHLVDTLTSTMSITPWNQFMLYLPTEDGSYDCELEQINMVSYVRDWQKSRETSTDLTLQKLKSVVTQG